MAEQLRQDGGRILIISGPSGVGKSTICQRLCRELPAEFSVSWTTRRSRPGETDGRDYHFVDQARFEKLAADAGFVEQAEVYGHRYGTPVAPLRQALEKGRTIILEIDINGAVQVRRAFPKARMVFLLPPTPAEQERRITGRRTDSESEIAKRLSRADGEIRYAQESGVYDRFLINDDLDETMAAIRRLLLQGD
ncbi:MAG: guanylate kinase [Phycisphaerae bacterium]